MAIYMSSFTHMLRQSGAKIVFFSCCEYLWQPTDTESTKWKSRTLCLPIPMEIFIFCGSAATHPWINWCFIRFCIHTCADRGIERKLLIKLLRKSNTSYTHGTSNPHVCTILNVAPHWTDFFPVVSSVFFYAFRRILSVLLTVVVIIFLIQLKVWWWWWFTTIFWLFMRFSFICTHFYEFSMFFLTLSPNSVLWCDFFSTFFYPPLNEFIIAITTANRNKQNKKLQLPRSESFLLWIGFYCRLYTINLFWVQK